MSDFALNRRNFIRIVTASSGGLLVSIPISCAKQAETGPPMALNAYLEISPDETITIYAPVPEIGQGVRTAIPMILAEELDVDWQHVRVKQAPAGDEFGPRQVAAGSASIAVYWEPMRRAGATARAVLIQAASIRWGTNPQMCTSEAGHIIHPNGRTKLSYGKLVAEASQFDPPENVSLKGKDDFSLIGTAVKNVDCEAIVTGTIKFGLDVERKGMLRAVIARCPTYGGRVKSYDATQALDMDGVVQAVKIEIVGSHKDRPYVDEGIAIVATSTWAAMQGRDALSVEWDMGSNIGESTDRLHILCHELLQTSGEVVRSDGDIEAGFAAASVEVEGLYHLPFIAHMCMEPMNCTAEVTQNTCEMWVPTQSPGNDRNGMARALGISKDAVNVYPMRCGGGFGRRVGPEDVSYEAIQIAKVVGRPVQVVWTREDDIAHDAYRPFSYHKMKAGMDAGGNITAWTHRQSSTSRYAFRTNSNPSQSEFFLNNFPGGLVDNYQLEYAMAESNLPRSILRAPGNNALSFVVESFIDELAHAANQDPFEFRMKLLGENRELEFDDDFPTISTMRTKRVLRTVVENSNWGQDMSENHGRGIASHFTFGSYVAYVVEVSVDRSSGEYTVDKVVAAIDCGQAVNLAGIRAQVEGGINDAIHAARYGEVTFTNGAVDQSNFHDYPLARMHEAALDIDIHIINDDAEPQGVGEPPYPPMFPALANALFAATGVRARSLPIKTDIFKAP